MEQHKVDVVVASMDLPPNGSSALLAAIRSHPEWERLPVIAVTDSTDHILVAAVRAAGFQDCQAKNDSAAILESVTRLALPLASTEPELACVGEDK